MASYDVVTEVAWAVGVCKEMGVDLLQNGLINVFMDNKSAIALANNPVFQEIQTHRCEVSLVERKDCRGSDTTGICQNR